MSKTVTPFTPSVLEALNQVLADTNHGLSGTEIGRFLGQAKIKDVDHSNTKWKRLFNALAAHQNEYKTGVCVLNFITHAMAPSRFRGKHDIFEDRRSQLNEVLSFHGLSFRED
ncbi:MAG TPA: hypothetical protein PLW14_08525 [Chlorobiota bacterium]|nr:hypothetical protein [Chlorobiota bacterium]